jgi:hypothetical protein
LRIGYPVPVGVESTVVGNGALVRRVS